MKRVGHVVTAGTGTVGIGDIEIGTDEFVSRGGAGIVGAGRAADIILRFAKSGVWRIGPQVTTTRVQD